MEPPIPQIIEAVQRRAARFCLNDFSHYSSVTSMLSTQPATFTTKRESQTYMNDLVDIPKDYFTLMIRDKRKGYYKQLMTYIDSYLFPSVIGNPLPPI